MRILHTIASIDPATGGPARSVPQLLMALKDAGLEVALWTAGFTQPEWQRPLREKGIPVYSGDLMSLPSFNLIHDHGLWLMNNHRVAKVARERGIPRIVSPRGMLEPWALNHKKWKKRAAWWLYQRADLESAAALHATADSEARQFDRLGLHLPVHVIPNGVDLPQLSSLSPQVSGFSSPVSGLIPQISSPKTALFLSRIHPKKGLPLLVEAWAKVRPEGWRMRVVGPDENGHRAEVEAMVSRADIAGDWSFEGPLDASQKDQAFASADLFILPTFSENFGIAVAEALAAGVPVITTTEAPWQGLVDTKSGWWVEPVSDALAGALQDACRCEADALREMGIRGREWMLRDFTWKSVASRMTRAYNELLSRS